MTSTISNLKPAGGWKQLWGIAFWSLCLITVPVISAGQARVQTEPEHPRAEKITGTWTLTLGTLYDVKDGPPLPPHMKDLPRDLPITEIMLKVEGGKLSGKQIVYRYTKAPDGSAPAVGAKVELTFHNPTFDGQVMSTRLRAPDGSEMPSIWEMKLVGEDEATWGYTDATEEEKKLVPMWKFRRARK